LVRVELQRALFAAVFVAGAEASAVAAAGSTIEMHTMRTTAATAYRRKDGEPVRGVGGHLGPSFAQTLDVDLLGLAELTAVHALRNWTPLLLDLYERTSFVVASRGPMACGK
jgi:hypothetical protein